MKGVPVALLSSLHIENIAVVRKLDVEFGGGLTVLTGETGAGKSIIVDSIGLIMGAKPNPQLIRTGETEAYVAALFTEISDTAARRLAECGVGLEDGEVYIERIITNGGKSKAKSKRAFCFSIAFASCSRASYNDKRAKRMYAIAIS